MRQSYYIRQRTQISTHPRATKQGRVKCRRLLYHSNGPNTGSNPGGGQIRKKKYVYQLRCNNQLTSKSGEISGQTG